MVSLFISNEDMGKKDDDHKPSKLIPPLRAPQWSASARVPPRKTLKRLAVALAVGLCIYLFIANIPTDLPIRDRRHPVYDPNRPGRSFPPPGRMPPPDPDLIKPPGKIRWGNGQGTTPNGPPGSKSQPAELYNGPVKFPHLLSSLEAIFETKGAYSVNKNILFAASSLKSAAALLPMACQMGSELRNYVHFALVGRSEISIDVLREVNGIDKSCNIFFHGTSQPSAMLVNGIARVTTL